MQRVSMLRRSGEYGGLHGLRQGERDDGIIASRNALARCCRDKGSHPAVGSATLNLVGERPRWRARWQALSARSHTACARSHAQSAGSHTACARWHAQSARCHTACARSRAQSAGSHTACARWHALTTVPHLVSGGSHAWSADADVEGARSHALRGTRKPRSTDARRPITTWLKTSMTLRTRGTRALRVSIGPDDRRATAHAEPPRAPSVSNTALCDSNRRNAWRSHALALRGAAPAMSSGAHAPRGGAPNEGSVLCTDPVSPRGHRGPPRVSQDALPRSDPGVAFCYSSPVGGGRTDHGLE